MSPRTHALFLFALCWLLAQVEIQIEGPDGWAEKLPTWRLDNPAVKKWLGKPVTGYHIYMTSFLLLVFHLPVLFTGFHRNVEARVLAYFFLTTIVWDFQWFVWNPAWGARRFFKEPIWWFPVKIGSFPREYYLGLGASFLSIVLIWSNGLPAWVITVIWLAIPTLLSVPAANWWLARGSGVGQDGRDLPVPRTGVPS